MDCLFGVQFLIDMTSISGNIFSAQGANGESLLTNVHIDTSHREVRAYSGIFVVGFEKHMNCNIAIIECLVAPWVNRRKFLQRLTTCHNCHKHIAIMRGLISCFLYDLQSIGISENSFLQITIQEEKLWIEIPYNYFYNSLNQRGPSQVLLDSGSWEQLPPQIKKIHYTYYFRSWKQGV